VSDRAPFLCGLAPEGRVHDDIQVPRKPRDPEIR
jgi:hypothetical protein